MHHTAVHAVEVASNWPSALMGAITMSTVVIDGYVLYRLKLNTEAVGAAKTTTKEHSVQGPMTHTGLRHDGRGPALSDIFLPRNDSSWGA